MLSPLKSLLPQKSKKCNKKTANPFFLIFHDDFFQGNQFPRCFVFSFKHFSV